MSGTTEAQAATKATRCIASTVADQGDGFGTYFGSCNGASTFLTVTSSTVLGRVGGLRVSLVGAGSLVIGHIGSWSTRYTIVGSTITGRYGPYSLFATAVGSTLIGRIGSARVTCLLLSTGFISCTGASGGAEAFVPLLARLWIG